MKKFILVYFSIIYIITAQGLPFSKGVNVTNWFQVDGAKQIHFTKYTKKDFEQLKSLGVDVVRLPINLHFMTDGAPNYKLDPLFLNFLNEVIDWTEELGIHLIIDSHTFDVNTNTDVNIDKVLIPVWKQMAENFKYRSNKIYYEILNEPHGISDSRWNQIQQAVVDSIRAIDSVHTIVVGPAGWNSYNNLAAMPIYKDNNLIYTFHFYDPFIFTHQGAGWSGMAPLAGVPFPYDAAKMPAYPTELDATASWVKNELLYNYKNNGTVAKVQSQLNIAINFSKQRNVPIFCGEFGVYIPNSPEPDRIYWYNEVRKYLERNNVAWTIWDYRGGFGLFEKNSQELFDHDLNVPLLEALGFNIPPQSEFTLKPDTTMFSIYSDYIGEKIENSSWSSGTLDFYNEENLYKGNYSIYWSGAAQYNSIVFDFRPDKDLSYLKNNDYVLDFMVKCDKPSASFDIRFLDSKTDVNDHPWRLGFRIDNNKIVFDNTWQNVRIALEDMYEFGSYDNGKWYEPAGLFDWEKIDKFEIVAEQGSLTGTKLWFDEVKIFNPSITGVEEKIILPAEYNLAQNYPNPFNPETTINYSLPIGGFVNITVYDLLGREAIILVNEEQSAGNHQIKFSAVDFSSGIYFYVLRAGDFISTKKMMLVK